MKTIKLTQGKETIVDDDWFEMLSVIKWHVRSTSKYWYAYSSADRQAMHRVIMDAPKGSEVDHINGNTLDNRRENLRIVTRSQNLMNRRQTTGAIKYKGVGYRKYNITNPYVARIRKDTRSIYIGAYPTAEEAALAYNNKAIELFGEYVHLNEVPNVS